MIKKIITWLVLSVIITTGIFAQETQRLTFVERKVDGTIGRTITADAIFVGFSQQEISIENGMQVTRESANVNGEWTPWEIVGTQPARVLAIRLVHDLLVQEYISYPRASYIYQMQGGLQAVRIWSIPIGRSSPLWWSEDGKSIYCFFEFWGIFP